MPIIRHRQIDTNKEIGIWNIDESMEELTSVVQDCGYDMERFFAISNEQVKKQWLAVRVLLHQMTSNFTDIVYDELGRPYLDGDLSVSITHSHDRVGIQLSTSRKVGIDLQLYNPGIEKIKEKFMSPEEIQHLDKKYALESMHVIWCAKETMFKTLRSEGVIFAEELFVEPFDYSKSFGLQGISTHQKNVRVPFELTFEKVDDYFLVYLVNP